MIEHAPDPAALLDACAGRWGSRALFVGQRSGVVHHISYAETARQLSGLERHGLWRDASLVAPLAALRARVPLDGGDVVASLVSWCRPAGLTLGLLLPLSCGATIWPAARADLGLMATLRPTVMIAGARELELLRARLDEAVTRGGPLVRALFRLRLGRARARRALAARGEVSLAGELERSLLARLTAGAVSAVLGSRLQLIVTPDAPAPEVRALFELIGVALVDVD